MKIVLLSLAIAVIGYFSLSLLPDRENAPRLASSGYDDASAPPRDARSARIYRH